VHDASRFIAAVLGLTGFAIAAVAGAIVDNPASLVLTRALLSSAGCYALGWLVARAFQHLFEPTPAAAGAVPSTVSPHTANEEKKL
jgi:hypothetical protein